jgi:hypothetical protein
MHSDIRCAGYTLSLLAYGWMSVLLEQVERLSYSGTNNTCIVMDHGRTEFALKFTLRTSIPGLTAGRLIAYESIDAFAETDLYPFEPDKRLIHA